MKDKRPFRSLWIQKQPFRCVIIKRCSENMQKVFRISILKCDFNKVAETALRHECSTLNFMRIFRTRFPKTPRRLLLWFERLILKSGKNMFRSWRKYYYHALFCRRVSWKKQIEKNIGCLNSSLLFHHNNSDLSIFLKKNKTNS